VSMDMTKPEYQVRIDRERAADLGVSAEEIAQTIRSLITGAVATRYREGDEYYDIREYVLGDDLRRIAWRVSARVGTWMVRQNAQQNARSLIIALEGRLPRELDLLDRLEDRAAYEADYEDAVDLAASLGVSLLRREYEVALVAPDAVVAPGKGTAHEKRLLNALAEVNLVDEVEYAGFADRLTTQDLRMSAMVYIAPDPKLWVGDGVPGRALVTAPRDVLHA